MATNRVEQYEQERKEAKPYIFMTHSFAYPAYSLWQNNYEGPYHQEHRHVTKTRIYTVQLYKEPTPEVINEAKALAIKEDAIYKEKNKITKLTGIMRTVVKEYDIIIHLQDLEPEDLETKE